MEFLFQDILAVRHSLRQILYIRFSIFYWQSESMFATGGSAVVSKKTWGGEKRRGHGGLLVSHCSRSGAQCTFDDRHITFS